MTTLDERGPYGPYDRIKQAILDGRLVPGEPLVEASLARWCGVSRTPVREALRRLEQDGLLERAEHGLMIRTRSPEEILELYETRIVLECEAARTACERRTGHDLAMLRWNLALSHEIPLTDRAEIIATGWRFHHTVRHATHNEALIDMLGRLMLHLGRIGGTTLASPGRWPPALAEHVAITDAIEARDAEEAARLAELHFGTARDIRLAALRPARLDAARLQVAHLETPPDVRGEADEARAAG